MFHWARLISLLYYQCLVYSYTSLNFCALTFKNRRRWYYEEKCIKIHEGSLTYLHARTEQPHARILGRLQNPGMLESKLSNTICHELQEQIKMPVMLMYPVQIIVATPFRHCRNKMQMRLTLQFHQSRYKQEFQTVSSFVLYSVSRWKASFLAKANAKCYRLMSSLWWGVTLFSKVELWPLYE